MPNNRKGKWQSFDALKGYKDSLREIENQREKIEKPILSEDELTELNYNLKDAFDNQKDIRVSYYQNGYIKSFDGKIIKIDVINRKIYLDFRIIDIDMITNIEQKA